MGWKGTLRSVNSAVKAAERESRRRQKELERRRKEHDKMLELEQASLEVEEFENYLERITSIHIDCSQKINWEKILNRSKPKEPKLNHNFERKAQQRLENYTPGILDKIFKRTEKKENDLELLIKKAKQKDKKDYNKSIKKYEAELEDWKDSKKFAERILDQNQGAWAEAIEELKPFDEIKELGASFEFGFEKAKPILSKINVKSEDIIPNKKKSLLKSGKLSIKNMPKGQFYAYYQDYVCSLILRVAGELFSLLPTKSVVITVVDDLLNSKTGHVEEQVILSVAIPRTTFEKLNLDMIDPSDSMQNFVYNMNFKKTKGFNSVDEVEWQNLEL